MAVMSSENAPIKQEKTEPQDSKEEEDEHLKDLRILLVGTTGSGKSSTGNTILSTNEENTEKVIQEFFGTAPTSAPQTRYNEELTRTIFGRKVTIVDTPGANNEDDLATEICEEIEAAVRHNEDETGYHAIVYVVKIFEKELQMNEEEIKTMEQVEQMLGDSFFDYVILLFTYGSNYQQMWNHLKNQNPFKSYPDFSFQEVISKDRLSKNRYAIGPFVRKVKERAVLFENGEKDAAKREVMVKELLDKVDEVVKAKEGKLFTETHLPEKKPKEEKNNTETPTWFKFFLGFLAAIIAIIAIYMQIKKPKQ